MVKLGSSDKGYASPRIGEPLYTPAEESTGNRQPSVLDIQDELFAECGDDRRTKMVQLMAAIGVTSRMRLGQDLLTKETVVLMPGVEIDELSYFLLLQLHEAGSDHPPESPRRETFYDVFTYLQNKHLARKQPGGPSFQEALANLCNSLLSSLSVRTSRHVKSSFDKFLWEASYAAYIETYGAPKLLKQQPPDGVLCQSILEQVRFWHETDLKRDTRAIIRGRLANLSQQI
jgi:hypothetical protein